MIVTRDLSTTSEKVTTRPTHPPRPTPRDFWQELWRVLFQDVRTQAELTAWELSLPETTCGCQPFYLDWKRDNPPVFPVPFEWKYDLKSAVNAKLGKPNLTLEEAMELWV